MSEAHRLLALLGEPRFGEPDETTPATIEAIRDLERLERLTKRVLDTEIHDWNGLLGTP